MATTTSSIGISDESDNKLLSTTVSVKSGRKKVYEADAHIVEAFKEKYIKVNIVDEDDHHFQLNWSGFMYEGNFFGTTITCQYEVTRDFKADLSVPERKESGPVVAVSRSKGGRPDIYKL